MHISISMHFYLSIHPQICVITHVILLKIGVTGDKSFNRNFHSIFSSFLKKSSHKNPILIHRILNIKTYKFSTKIHRRKHHIFSHTKKMHILFLPSFPKNSIVYPLQFFIHIYSCTYLTVHLFFTVIFPICQTDSCWFFLPYRIPSHLIDYSTHMYDMHFVLSLTSTSASLLVVFLFSHV